MARKKNALGIENQYIQFSPEKAKKALRIIKSHLAKNAGCRFTHSLYKELNELTALYNQFNTEIKTAS